MPVETPLLVASKDIFAPASNVIESEVDDSIATAPSASNVKSASVPSPSTVYKVVAPLSATFIRKYHPALLHLFQIYENLKKGLQLLILSRLPHLFLL